jgi:hypothetical protein
MRDLFQAYCACGRVTFEASGKPMTVISCYCDDCQNFAKELDASGGHSGVSADGGTIGTMYRKDLVRCVSGEDLLIDRKFRPGSPTTRQLTSCCNSNVLTKFDNWLPMVVLRTHSKNVDSVRPRICIHTKFAPDPARIQHDAQRAAKLPPNLILKVLGAAATLAIPKSLADGRVT